MNKRKKLLKANELNDKIERLEYLVRDLRPEHCNGLGVCRSVYKNEKQANYKYNFWSTHKSNTEIEDLLLKVGIEAMYNKACELLVEHEKAFEDLEIN
jgi:hypothetical protein